VKPLGTGIGADRARVVGHDLAAVVALPTRCRNAATAR
jgi:hypothetical protein